MVDKEIGGEDGHWCRQHMTIEGNMHKNRKSQVSCVDEGRDHLRAARRIRLPTRIAPIAAAPPASAMPM
jgi:hypothetical protein